ncbi:MAG: ABC transporter permease, partial [Candidatus Thorarchaeota archaeon]
MTESRGLSTRIKQITAIMIKDIRIYYTRGPTLIFGLLFPSFFFLAFVVGRAMDPILLLPGLLAMVVFFSATAVSPVIMPIETGAHTLERLLTLPVPFWATLLGDALASFSFAIITSSIPITLLFLFVTPSLFTAIYIVGTTILGCFFFSLFGLLLSSPPADQPSTIMMLTSLVKFPLIFISGIFVPLQSMPQPFVLLSLFSPLTYLVDLLNGLILGVWFIGPLIDFVIIICFTLILAKTVEIAHS